MGGLGLYRRSSVCSSVYSQESAPTSGGMDPQQELELDLRRQEFRRLWRLDEDPEKAARRAAWRVGLSSDLGNLGGSSDDFKETGPPQLPLLLSQSSGRRERREAVQPKIGLYRDERRVEDWIQDMGPAARFHPDILDLGCADDFDYGEEKVDEPIPEELHGDDDDDDDGDDDHVQETGLGRFEMFQETCACTACLELYGNDDRGRSKDIKDNNNLNGI